MDKYQEALDNFKNIGEKDIWNERHLKWTDTLQELIDQVSLIKKALLEGIETIEFGVIDNPYYISLKRSFPKDSSIGLHVYVKEEGMAFYYSIESYGILWKLKDDKWKVENE